MSQDVYWYKKGVNVGSSTMRHWMKQMATIVGIPKDITNKFGRVTSITWMAIIHEVMALIIGYYRNLKILGHYDMSIYTWSILRLKHYWGIDKETGYLLDFDWYYNQQLALWNGKETPPLKEHPFYLDNEPLPCMSFIAPQFLLASNYGQC